MIARRAAVLALATLTLAGCGSQGARVGAGRPAPDRVASVSGSVQAGAGTLTGHALAAPAAPPGVYGLGDSVMLGSQPLLTHAGITVDAVVGRQFGSAVSLLRRKVVAGTLPRNVVVHLGTNGTIAAKDCHAVVDAAGPSRRVFFVNVLVPRSWTVGNNRVLSACDAAYAPDRVQVIDWANAVAAHPGWLGPDRIHPLPSGRMAYTSLIETSLQHHGW